MNRDFEEILDNCINQIIFSEKSVEECLAKYPEHKEKLKHLLATLSNVRKIPKPIPSACFKTALKDRLIRQLEPKKVIPLSAKRTWIEKLSSLKPAIVQVAAGILIFVFLSSGVMMASANSLPGDSLYPIKIAKENIQLALTFNKMAKAELHLQFAQRRLSEIETVLRDERDADLNNIVNSMIEHTNEVAVLADEISNKKREEILIKLSNFIQHKQESLKKIMDKAPAKNNDAIKETIKETIKEIIRVNEQEDIKNNQERNNLKTTPEKEPCERIEKQDTYEQKGVSENLDDDSSGQEGEDENSVPKNEIINDMNNIRYDKK